jgi:16S rRNA (guanine(966)-N(2))-methyltransferase RsmD
MRIIAGVHRGRRIDAPNWAGVRPTSDRLRETLFNILAPRIEDARVLDGCAGTGAVGIEALSRGAAHVTFVDADRRAIELVTRNLARCGIASGHAIIRADLASAGGRFSRAAFDLVFLDPPYDTDPAEMMQAAGEWLDEAGLLVVEHAKRRAMPERANLLRQTRRVAAGDSVLTFYVPEPPSDVTSEVR